MNDSNRTDATQSKTQLGLPAHVEALLCYAFGFVTGLLFFFLEKENRFVRFHAVQSTILFLALAAIHSVLFFVPFVGGILAAVLGVGTLALWIFLMVKAYRGERFELPRIGELATAHAG